MTGTAQSEGGRGGGTAAALTAWGAARSADLGHALDASGGTYLAGITTVAAFLGEGKEGGMREWSWLDDQYDVSHVKKQRRTW